MEGELVIVKLGGSVITDKSKPLTSRPKTIDSLARVLARSKLRLVVVHGGGSFGHPLAEAYGLTLEPKKANPEAVSRIHNAMLRLNLLVSKALEKHGLNPYTLQPLSILYGESLVRDQLLSLLSQGLTPLTFGDVIVSQEGSRIISGDTLISLLAEELKPLRVVFTLSADGVYKRPDDPSTLIRELKVSDGRPDVWPVSGDVTGGMKLKLREAIRIASAGVEVRFVNGMNPQRVLKALKGENFMGTVVRIA